MAKQKKKIKYKKERVVLSDILPFEIPITFSNRHFYNFLVKNKIQIKDNDLTWKKGNDELNEIIKFIFNLSQFTEESTYNKASFNRETFYTIPFYFKISHKDKEFRELSVIHPANQIAIIDFYNKYKELILFYCSISPYSIRKPHKIAKYTYFNDDKHSQNKVDKPERNLIELYGKEYQNLKTFFAYEKYNNIHEFYESYSYHRCEKKYNKLFKFDISKCFDSIYTHSICWAILNKEIVKNNVPENGFTFGGAFDTLMQKLNYNETNGIVIGPEISRIFAEILFQQIDFSIFKKLEEKQIFHKTHYDLFRYVDDYFLFYNDEEVKDVITELFKIELKKYGLYTNETKTFFYTKPIITELTIAKESISNLLNSRFELKSEIIDKSNESENEELENLKPKKYSIYFDSKKTIVEFKSIIKVSNIEYKDILNYTLAILDKKVFNILNKYDKAIFKTAELEYKFKLIFIKSIIEILDFIFFLYSVSPRVNTTIKLCTLLSKLTKFIKEKKDNDNAKAKYFKRDYLNMVFKKISDDISLVLSKNKNSEFTQIETLYLLIVLYDLGKEYRLDKETLFKYLNIKVHCVKGRNEYTFPYTFNYWSISVLLFYMRNLVRYNDLRDALKEHIIDKFKRDNNNIRKKAEYIILTLDLLACPYLDEFGDVFKIKLLNACGFDKALITKKIDLINKIKSEENLFTKWKNFNFEKELNTKRSQEVY